jgi:hypothetical protein
MTAMLVATVWLASPATGSGPTTHPTIGTGFVSGAAVTEPALADPPATYGITFAESGLPAGQTFQLTVNGTPKSLTTDGAKDNLTWTGLPNGSYAYTLADISGYHQSTLAYTGHVVVNGSSVTEATLAYRQVTYIILFAETGLPAGTAWGLVFNGAIASSDGLTISLTEPNGTYNFTVSTVGGYSASPSSGSIKISGTAASQTVKFTASPSSPGIPWWFYAAIGLMVLGIVGLLLLVAFGRRRRDSDSSVPPPDPPSPP